MTTRRDIDSFFEFATSQVGEQGTAVTVAELAELWEHQTSPPEERLADLAAVRAALNDMERGDRGRPARDVLEEVCRELGISRDA